VLGGRRLVVSGVLASCYLPILDASTASDTASAARTGPVAMSYTFSPSGFLRALLGPYPWPFGPTSDTDYRASYPGMVGWILMLPALALGCWELLRRGPWAARGLAGSALTFLYVYATVFQDQGFFRQRYTVEIPLLVVDLYGFQRYPHRPAMGNAVGACVVAPAALVQTRMLSLSDLALVVAALGSVWWVGRLACGRWHHVIRWRRRVRHVLVRTQANGGRGG
jgi:hypothetical protein